MAGATEQLLEAAHAALTDVLPGWTIHKGRLHDSLGSSDDGGQMAGVSPEEDAISARNQLVLEPIVLVQVFLQWEKIVDNERVVPAQPIMDLAHLFRREIETRQTGTTNHLWYLEISRLWYPDDPVGQKTRFHALVRGRANNNAVVETTL